MSQIYENKYCNKCGKQLVEKATFCTYCGTKISSIIDAEAQSKSDGLKIKPIYIILAIVAVVVILTGYIGANYFQALSAMSNGDFDRSKKYFDNIPFSENVFSDQYAYIDANLLMREGEYLEALQLCKGISDKHFATDVADLSSSLEYKTYYKGQLLYRGGSLIEAKEYFLELDNYKRSQDYLLLIKCSDEDENYGKAQALMNYDKLVAMLGFEDTSDIILRYPKTAIKFLCGKWVEGVNSFQVHYDGYSIKYNFPADGHSGIYYGSQFDISDGTIYVDSKAVFSIEIVGEDVIRIWHYSGDGILGLGHNYYLNRSGE